jgi:hypothetical protein
MATIDIGEDGVPQNNVNLSDTQSITSGNSYRVRPPAEQVIGGTDGALGNSVIPVVGAQSMFNPFTIFRYSKFSEGAKAVTPGIYNFQQHSYTYQKVTNQSEFVKTFKEAQLGVENPSATNIINYSRNEAERAEKHTGPLYPYPYSINDFLYCKWYGKIPNNRLLTLRRYPIPVEDNLAIAGEKLPLVPIAQAVTWWGGETGNKLSEILGITYGFNWEPVSSEVTDITGNEITAEALLDTLGLKKDSNSVLRQAILTYFTNSENPFEFSGYDATLQQFTKDSWARGAYWNRVLGPINVIDSTQIRKRGYKYEHNIKLVFEYKLRSFGLVNPKVALLDLISNFMSLTYNKAQFWGGGYRYFQQTGVLFPEFNTEPMEKGNYVDAIKEISKTLGTQLQGKLGELKETLDKMGSSITSLDASKFAEQAKKILGESDVVNKVVSSKLKYLQQTPLVLRSLLDGRAVGEWHLMVGNPMDPLAVIGNLCLKSTTLEFSDDLGTDDFPTTVKFTVNLIPGRPRAKQDIESMFNLGGGDLGFTALAPPASTANSYGEYVTNQIGSAYGTLNAAEKLKTSIQNAPESENLANYFRVNVAKSYGVGFANSPILVDYFTQLKTKD